MAALAEGVAAAGGAADDRPRGRGLGLGIGWREPLASLAYRRADLGFVEVVAEAFPTARPIPLPLDALRRRGVQIVPHGVRLSLGSPGPPDLARLAALAHLAERVDAPFVSEHIAFVRAGGVEAGHLLPVARSRAMLEVLVANVEFAMARLPVPLALEPIAALVEWPDAEIDEGDFVSELLERTGALLLLDVANVYANSRNHGYDPVAMLDRLPLDRLAYVHVAGGRADGAGRYHDSHAHPVTAAVIDLLDHLAARRPVPGVMLERDSRFPPTVEIDRGAGRRLRRRPPRSTDDPRRNRLDPAPIAFGGHRRRPQPRRRRAGGPGRRPRRRHRPAGWLRPREPGRHRRRPGPQAGRGPGPAPLCLGSGRDQHRRAELQDVVRAVPAAGGALDPGPAPTGPAPDGP